VHIFQSNVPRYFRDHELPEYLDFLDSSGCPYFVVTVNGVVVACGGFGIRAGSDGADLCWGMVDATRHRKRIGEFLLLGRLYRISKETDAKHIRLGTCQLTEGFFRRYGFETQSRTRDGVADGLDDVQMRMELTDDNRALICRQWMELTG
jgi:predicted GNAT family N-acyltransferase